MMKNLFKNKKIGFYLICLDIVLAVVLAITFLAMYKLGNGNGQSNLANKAYAALPEVIGIFALVGALVDVAALLLPEYGFVHLIAIAMYCISLGKLIYTIPDIIVGVANGVAYEGGNFPLNLFWLILEFLIIGSGIAALFMGSLSAEDEEAAKKEKIAGPKLVKLATAAALTVVAIGAGAGVSSFIDIEAKAAPRRAAEKARKQFLATWEPKKVSYDFEPADFELSEEDNEYSFAGLSQSATTTMKSKIKSDVGTNLQDRAGHYKVFEFEGSTAEGWQGDYSLKKAFITCWDDGLYLGTIDSNSVNTYGYWYNVDDEGKPCLNLMSAANDGNDLVCDKNKGDDVFYEWKVDVKAAYNRGRLIKVSGFKYYPVIGMYIDTGSDTLEYKKGDTVNTGIWTPTLVNNALTTASIFDAEHDVKWSNTKITAEAGEIQTLTATWSKEGKTHKAEVEVKVVEAAE